MVSIVQTRKANDQNNDGNPHVIGCDSLLTWSLGGSHLTANVSHRDKGREAGNYYIVYWGNIGEILKNIGVM